MPIFEELQHKQCQSNYQHDKRNRKQRKEPKAIKSNLQIPKEQPPAALLGLAYFGLTIRADIPHLVAVADGKVALHRRHSDLVVEFLMANRTRALHISNITKMIGRFLRCRTHSAYSLRKDSQPEPNR